MSVQSETLPLVRAAEKKLLAAIAIAAKSGDLDAIDHLRAAIRELRAICTPPQREARLGASTIAGKSREDRTVGAATKYPRFMVQSDTLYRVAWSRKTKNEYEHKVPKNAVSAIVQAMAAAANASVEPITVDSILARVNRTNPIQVPQYQVYLVIGWLRHARLIEQVGRDGYRIPRDVVRLAQENWQELLTPAG